MIGRVLRSMSSFKMLIVLLFVFCGFSYWYFNSSFLTGITGLEGGGGLIDTTFNYTPEDAYALLDSYGETGRHNYVLALFIDFIYSILSFTTLSVVIIYTFQKCFPNIKWLHSLYWIPVLGAGFDFLENIGILILLFNYPDHLDGVAVVANLFTMSKLVLVNTAFYLCFIGVAGVILNKARIFFE